MLEDEELDRSTSSEVDVLVDFITKLLLIVKKDMILVVCNELSKMAHFVATTEETLVEGLA